MAQCEYYNVCERQALDSHNGKCTLHSEDPEKDEEEFRRALKSHREQKEDLRGIVFPIEMEFDEGGLIQSDFQDATFLRPVSFRSVLFRSRNAGESLNFRHATFHEEAKFIGAKFENGVSFSGATFQEKVDFTGATFEEVNSFMETTFKRANFTRISVAGDITFARSFQRDREVRFESAWFLGANVQGKLRFRGESLDNCMFAGGTVRFDQVEQSPEARISFKNADLSRAHFLGTNVQSIEFTGVKWCRVPGNQEWFDRAGLYDEVREEGETFSKPWPGIERLYRQLKKNYEERGDYPRAGDFHIGEKEMRRRNPETRWGPRLLLNIYRALSKYGERALPAVLWLIGIVLVCMTAYVSLGAMPGGKPTPLSPWRIADWIRGLTISMETTFFPVQSAGFRDAWPRLLNVIQRILSPPIIALLVLALRQRVKR